MVEAALGRGGVGSLLFVTDPAEINRLQRLAIEGNRLGIPAAVRLRRHPRAAHDPPGADRDGGLLGPRRRSSAARRSPPGRRARSASTGRSRRWSTSPATRAGAGSSRAPARTRTSAPPSPPRRSAASRATELGAPERIIAGPKHFAGLRRRARRPRLRRGQPLRLRAVERLLPAVRGGGRRRRRQHHDRLHGPQRHPGHRQPLAVHRRAARRRWGFEGFVVSDANAVRNLVTHGFAADLPDAGARARRRRARHGDGHRRPGLRAPARGARRRRRRRGRRSTRACGGCSRRSSGWACSTTPTSTRTAPARCSPTRRTARSPASPPSGPRCCCATRAACCRSTPRRSARSR